VETKQSLKAEQTNGVIAEHSPSAFLNLEALEATPLRRDPFAFVTVPNFVRPECLKQIHAGFPAIAAPGSFPPDTLEIRAEFRVFLDELQADSFQRAIERKFEIDLAGRPKLITLRGQARQKDGAMHTDTAAKLISVLLYMNEDWTAEGGRLRLLRSQNLDDSITEISPIGGTLVAFRRSAMSWHGHLPCTGQRRVIQLNWMSDEKAAMREHNRHRIAVTFKKLSRLFSP
jgi:hypothetical protein